MIPAKAVFIRESGGPEVLEIRPFSLREPGGAEVLVEVAASGLNRADLLQRRGFYPAPPGVEPAVPGLEYAGRVAATGPNVHSLKVGDRVMGIVAGGGMATHVLVHEREVLPIPDTLDTIEAAAIPEAFLTAFDAVFLQGKLRAGETILIHAAGSGVGTAAVQLARRAGSHVIGTSRSRHKLDRLVLNQSICVEDNRFAEFVQTKPNLILDTIGAAYLKENLKAIAPLGRIVTIGLLGGISGTLPLGLLLAKRSSIIGTVLRSRPLEEKASLAQQFKTQVLPGFQDGTLAPVIDSIVPINAIQDAHERMDRNETFGKVILTW